MDDNAIYPAPPESGLSHGDQVQTLEQQEKIFSDTDINDDGEVTREEFLESNPGMDATVFDMKDTDNNGVVTKVEFFNGIVGHISEEIPELFDEFTSDIRNAEFVREKEIENRCTSPKNSKYTKVTWTKSKTSVFATDGIWVTFSVVPNLML